MVRVLQAVIATAITVFVFSFGGRIEGALFPVADPAVFTSIEADGEVHSLVSGESRKLRDCSFVGVEFRVGPTDRYVVAALEFLEGTKNRGEGRFSFGPWRVQLTLDQMKKVTVIVFHQCHPFWKTETRWYG